MEMDKPRESRLGMTACVEDMSGADRKGEMERDIVSSGMCGVTLCQRTEVPLAPQLPIKRSHLPLLWE